MYNKHVKEQARLAASRVARGIISNPNQNIMKLPETVEDDDTQRAPISIKCLSMEGELWRISGLDFYKIILKDKKTLD